MITIYFLISALWLGYFIGSFHQSKDFLGLEGWAWVVIISLFWPVIAYLYARDWRAKP